MCFYIIVHNVLVLVYSEVVNFFKFLLTCLFLATLGLQRRAGSSRAAAHGGCSLVVHGRLTAGASLGEAVPRGL